MTAEERRRAILEKLCIRRYATRENLAFEFGVSIRTIATDLQYLSQEYPIYTIQGNKGGIRIMDGFYLNRKYLSDKQVSLLKRLSANLTGEDRETMSVIIKTFTNHKEIRHDNSRD